MGNIESMPTTTDEEKAERAKVMADYILKHYFYQAD
jgi:hypothetical protein